eukprot:TRINITY_DN14431_c0_g1_i1.p1 TRINITY_DN14431_c0_g1~~TRINITY_DN14431_c0_g1_i1.p1  ORF type:complete len:277 (-),score=15.08 TRINITY_DN14431_c0_g1_i1:166-996(-)
MFLVFRIVVVVVSLVWSLLYPLMVVEWELGWGALLIAKPIPIILNIAYQATVLNRTGTEISTILMIVSLCVQVIADECLILDEAVWKTFFLIGLGFFLIGHIFNATAFSLGPQKGDERPKLHWLRLIPFVIVGIAIYVFLLTVGEMPSIPVIIALVFYIGAIGAAGWRASARIGYQYDSTATQVLKMLGYCLYICSDGALAIDAYAEPFKNKLIRNLVVYFTYYPANALITISLPRQPNNNDAAASAQAPTTVAAREASSSRQSLSPMATAGPSAV